MLINEKLIYRNCVNVRCQVLPRDTMLSTVYAVVCVCLSHSGIVSKQLNVRITQIMQHDSPRTLKG